MVPEQQYLVQAYLPENSYDSKKWNELLWQVESCTGVTPRRDYGHGTFSFCVSASDGQMDRVLEALDRQQVGTRVGEVCVLPLAFYSRQSDGCASLASRWGCRRREEREGASGRKGEDDLVKKNPGVTFKEGSFAFRPSSSALAGEEAER
eukprot:CAMPEP_0119149798 /NCGR_PEP_ID=MMETSP1310-20130426/43865_1 /TAXON_ID=464262 /ORGANISM="Genus nov. species nov., Strain RCC2339" /LENGTH=149 /DNA_ID=CAMNT_0007141933 /DNA_START=32 /DNA_END=478 /DNA_ORIENTATION=-